MSAKEMFQKMGWSYEYVNGDGCEDSIQCRDMTRTMILNNFSTLPNIQFNLISKCIVINDLMFVSMNILRAINQQCKELGWEIKC